MKFTTFAVTLALGVIGVSAEKLNVPSVISDFYGSTAPSLNDAQSTSLASALNSVAVSFTDSPTYISVIAGIVYGAPNAVQTSYWGPTGGVAGDIATETWFSNVPKPAQTGWQAYMADLNKAASSAIGTLAPTKTSKGAAAPMKTGMSVAGVIGVVGGVLAAL